MMRTQIQLVVAVSLAMSGCSLAGRVGLGGAPSGSGSSGPASSQEAAPVSVADGGGEAPTTGCDERWITIADPELEPVLTLMRCPTSEPRSSGDNLRAYAEARSWLREQLDAGIVDDATVLPRAAYVHLCARELSEDSRPPVIMAITCAWHASQIDKNALRAELAKRADGNTLAAQADKDQRTVKERALAAFPQAAHAREWELFYQLPTKVRADVAALRAKRAADIKLLLSLDAKIQGGAFDGCEKPLRDALSAQLKSVKTLVDVATRMEDPITYALAEGLARCHYYNERELEASVVVAMYGKARRRVSLAENIRWAQIDLIAKDQPKAEKFPNLVGTKYSSVKVDYFRPVTPTFRSKLDQDWYFKQHSLQTTPLGSTTQGRVSRVEKSGTKAKIIFQRERVPLVDLECRETDRIDRITPEGKVIWREVCTRTPKGMTWSTPEPVTISNATLVTPGKYVRIVKDGDDGAVITLTEKDDESSRVYRIADVPVGS